MRRDWRHILGNRLGPGCSLVGIGHRLRGDDAVGLRILAGVEGKVQAGLFCCESVPEKWLGPITRSRPSTVVVLDAADFGGRPGEIRILEIEDIPEAIHSTHVLSPSVFMRLLRENTGADVFMLAVQPKDLRFGATMTEPVKRAADRIAQVLLDLIPVREASGPQGG